MAEDPGRVPRGGAELLRSRPGLHAAAQGRSGPRFGGSRGARAGGGGREGSRRVLSLGSAVSLREAERKIRSYARPSVRRPARSRSCDGVGRPRRAHRQRAPSHPRPADARGPVAVRRESRGRQAHGALREDAWHGGGCGKVLLERKERTACLTKLILHAGTRARGTVAARAASRPRGHPPLPPSKMNSDQACPKSRLPRRESEAVRSPASPAREKAASSSPPRTSSAG